MCRPSLGTPTVIARNIVIAIEVTVPLIEMTAGAGSFAP
jgi:hypothetical protein